MIERLSYDLVTRIVSEQEAVVQPDRVLQSLAVEVLERRHQQREAERAADAQATPPEGAEEAEGVGRVVHEALKANLLSRGYADHAWGLKCDLGWCMEDHHPCMKPWEDLREEYRQEFIAMGMAGYAAGYARGWEARGGGTA